ncbi:hypothetical protein V6N11_007037 [Hibiscus sabdariffa]|uniref:Uncharacterized protein n=1 Tax=Hibiscus sabdariffa TaxID=183260 RepID=A0ABR2RSX7_9ROSI
MEKGTEVRVQFKRVKANKMGKMKENGECLREEQREIRGKLGEMERQCERVKEETEMMVKQTARTQIKLALMFNILKAREVETSLKPLSSLSYFEKLLPRKEQMKTQSKRI